MSLSGGVNMASYLLWAGQSMNQNLSSKCVVCMKLFMIFMTFLSHINKTFVLSINA